MPQDRNAVALGLAVVMITVFSSELIVARDDGPVDVTNLRRLAGVELIYVGSDGTITTKRFRDGKASTVGSRWQRTSILLSKSSSKSLFVLNENRLFQVSPDSPDRPQKLREFPLHAHDVALHPTKDWIVWCKWVPPTNPELISSKLDGSDEENLGFGYDPIWSVDGRKLIYTGNDAENGWFTGIREGTQTRRIRVPVHPSIGVFPCPSPNGNQIAFAMKGADGTRQIGLVSWDGKEFRQLTRKGDLNTMPSFSPSGEYIAFMRGDSPNASVVVVDVQTGEETTIATSAQLGRPIWRSVAMP